MQLPPGEGVNPGVMKLGARIGNGHFGDVYTIEGIPNQVLKVIHKLEGGAASVVREAGGAGLLKGLVRTPAIRGLRNGGDTGLSYIIKDKVPDIEVPNDLTPEIEPFVGHLYSTLARNGRVWLDGHLNNIYVVRDAAGKVVDVGIHDPDMINMATDPAVAVEMGRIVRLFQRPSVPGETPPMARLFDYSNRAKTRTSTRPRSCVTCTSCDSTRRRRSDAEAHDSGAPPTARGTDGCVSGLERTRDRARSLPR